MRRTIVVSWVLVVLLLVCGNSFAEENGVKVSGFMTAIFSQGRNEMDAEYGNGLAGKDPEWDTRDNHLGIQFASVLNPDMDVTAQFISRGGVENYSFNADWAYVDYRIVESVRFRIGKYKIPQFIASDYLDVGYAYPWVRPPQDVYATNPLISLNGLDMLFKIDLGGSKILLDLYVGDGIHTSYIPARTVDSFNGAIPDSRKGEEINFDTKKTRGISLKYATDTFTMRAGYFKTLVDAYIEISPATPTAPATALDLQNVPGAFGGIGFTMDVENIIVYAEYVRRDTDPEMEVAFPDQDAWYTTVGYRFGKFMPTLTYSRIRQGVDKSSLAIEEQSKALGFRYDIAKSVDIKFEILRVNPEKEPSSSPFTSEYNHGLFESPVENGTIATLSFDVIF